MRASSAARMLFGWRLLPLAFAVLVIAVLCIPSFVLLEPSGSTEPVGRACLAAAIFGAAIWITGVARVVRSSVRSMIYLRRRSEEHPFFALAGVLRPRVIVSDCIRRALAPDNLKFLLILLSPEVFPFVRGFARLNVSWRRSAEWAADDYAGAGSPESRLVLASALLKVSRTRSYPGRSWRRPSSARELSSPGTTFAFASTGSCKMWTARDAFPLFPLRQRQLPV
jgi:hypothetical protein